MDKSKWKILGLAASIIAIIITGGIVIISRK